MNRVEGCGFLCLTGCPVAIALSQPAAGPGDAPARLLTVFTPGGFDDLVAELRGMPPADAGDETKRDVIRARHGIRIIHPMAGGRRNLPP